jgi:hypothetical protein
MSEFNRITPEEVVEAFNETGLIPKQGRYFNLNEKGSLCACGLGALYDYKWGLNDDGIRVTKDNIPELYQNIGEFLEKEYSTTYRIGFAHGFDDIPTAVDFYKSDSLLEEMYSSGHEDGRAAYEAVRKDVKNV